MTSETASDAVADRVRKVRLKQGLKATDLAQRCLELGVPHLTAATISNIETGRRDDDGRRRRTVSVDELFALAAALNVAPVHLLIPLDSEAPYKVTPAREANAPDVRAWVRGFDLLPDTDPRVFWSEVPAVEFGANGPTDDERRYSWAWQTIGYLMRSMGRLYRRDDGTGVFEVELPKAGEREMPKAGRKARLARERAREDGDDAGR